MKNSRKAKQSKLKIYCAGLIGWDNIGHTNLPMAKGDDLPGLIFTKLGGVITNIAVALTDFPQKILDLEVILLSGIGDDYNSTLLLSNLSDNKAINCNFIQRGEGAADGYICIESNDGLFGAIASSNQLEKFCQKIFDPLISSHLEKSNKSFNNYLVIDSNLTTKSIDYLSFDSFFDETKIIIACASPFKAKKLRSLLSQRACTIYANIREASEIIGTEMQCSSEAANYLFELGAKEAIVTNGQNSTSSRSDLGLAVHHPIPNKLSQITGAGDTFLAAHLLSKILNGQFSEEEHLKIADAAAQRKMSLSRKE